MQRWPQRCSRTLVSPQTPSCPFAVSPSPDPSLQQRRAARASPSPQLRGNRITRCRALCVRLFQEREGLRFIRFAARGSGCFPAAAECCLAGQTHCGWFVCLPDDACLGFFLISRCYEWSCSEPSHAGSCVDTFIFLG